MARFVVPQSASVVPNLSRYHGVNETPSVCLGSFSGNPTESVAEVSRPEPQNAFFFSCAFVQSAPEQFAQLSPEVWLMVVRNYLPR